jgi:hypothetical protein
MQIKALVRLCAEILKRWNGAKSKEDCVNRIEEAKRHIGRLSWQHVSNIRGGIVSSSLGRDDNTLKVK